mmetsp:Transcript_51724/g.82200  ORF Transcript_51724/g.82200 Transcript_51724/m.82200 type:complete len:98 (+) Transcript_51724:38-331(+)
MWILKCHEAPLTKQDPSQYQKLYLFNQYLRIFSKLQQSEPEKADDQLALQGAELFHQHVPMNTWTPSNGPVVFGDHPCALCPTPEGSWPRPTDCSSS